MMIHAYLTNGFIEMAKVFLESCAFVHKDNPPLVWLDTRGLTPEESNDLLTYYHEGLLFINRLPLDVVDMAKRAGIPVETMRKYKDQIEKRFVTNQSRVWKLMIAGDDRVQMLYNRLWDHSADLVGEPGEKWQKDFQLNPPTFIAHFDIDTLFLQPMYLLYEMMEKADIWLKLRPGHNIIKARITIDCIIVRPTDGVRAFFDHWRHHINRVPPIERPIGWGQGSCWYAFEETKAGMNYATLPLQFGLPGRGKNNIKQGDLLAPGNVAKLAKDDCVKRFRKELDSWKM